MIKSSSKAFISAAVEPASQSRDYIAIAIISGLLGLPRVADFSDKRVWIKPDDASKFLKLNFVGQRNVRLDHVRSLSNAMTSGSYAPNNVIAISYNPDRPDDVSMICLLNGQHTLHAIISSNRSQPLIVSLFPCRTRAEIEFHYAVFDQGRVRTQLDISKAVGLNDAVRISSLPKAAITALGSSSSLLRAHLTDSRLVEKDKRRNAIISKMWVNEAAQIFSLIEGPDRRLNPDALPIGATGKLFRKRLISHAFFAVALVSMRSHPGETEQDLRDLVAMADSADQGSPEGDQFVWGVVDYVTTVHLGTGTERRIAAYNFAHLLVEMRYRRSSGDRSRKIGGILINGVPSLDQSTALWDTLTEDRLPRSIVNV
jgi:hypothetical protein